MKTEDKIEKLKEILKNYNKVALAFSGGADSTMLAYLAKESGCDVLAITYDNQIFPNGFLEFAKRRCEEIGIKHEIIEDSFLDVDDFIQNTQKRCLLCRNIMYGAIKHKANEEGYQIIIDGNNITDLIHDRPGILMKYKYNIESPFIEAKLETAEIHKFLKDNDIEYSKSTTCLATRIKTNEMVSFEKINRIDYGEDFIKKISNCEVVKLRENNNTATIEMDNINTILDEDKIESIYSELKKLNYDKILLNIDLNKDNDDLIEDNELEKGKTNLVLRKQLPFNLNIDETSKAIEKYLSENSKNESSIKDFETLEDIGYIKLKIDNKDSRIFRDGKISIENNKNREDAKDSLVKILPLMRRTV